MSLFVAVECAAMQAAGSRESLSYQVSSRARSAQVLLDREQTVRQSVRTDYLLPTTSSQESRVRAGPYRTRASAGITSRQRVSRWFSPYFGCCWRMIGSLWCSDTVGWMTGTTSSLWKLLLKSQRFVIGTQTWSYSGKLSHVHTLIHTTFYGPFPELPGWADVRRNLLDFMVHGKMSEAHTPAIRMGATPSGLNSSLPLSSTHFYTACSFCRMKWLVLVRGHTFLSATPHL